MLHNQACTAIRGALTMQRLFNRRDQIYRVPTWGGIGGKPLKLKIGELSQCAHVTSPTQRGFHSLVALPGLQTLLQHPLRLSLLTREFLYGVASQPIWYNTNH